MPHGHAELGEQTPQSRFYDTGRFGRLFPSLPPFAADTPRMHDVLRDIGAQGGPMDAKDGSTDPVTLILDPALSAGNPNNPNLTAGFTFLGQFLDHDMTFDPTSSLARRQDPEAIRNFRIPALDLDSVYGGGPAVSPHLYDQTVDGGRTTMLVEDIPGSAAVSADGSPRSDLPRNSQSVALVGDPRNDENLIVSQLHVALLRFHNVVVADVRADAPAGVTADEVFTEAQRTVRWHYQWLVIHEFLARTVDQPTLDRVLRDGPRFYKWRNDPYIPVEFSVGAYRFGHSQVRPSYLANFGDDPSDIAHGFAGLVFDPDAGPSADPPDLRGRCRAPRRYVDWQTFFDFGDGRARPNKRIDTVLSSVLFRLMGQPAGEPTSLASRNLLRGLSMKVPSGQRVAKAMELPLLEAADLSDLREHGLERRTPLWFYVLREASVVQDGQRLGPVGSRIVAEVIVGLILGDRQSYLRQEPDWTPTYGHGDDFRMTDLLTAAGVVASLA